jgi:phage tail-like protein
MQATELLTLLPEIVRRTARPGTPLDALLQVMAELPLRDERILTGLDAYFDPGRAPDRFVPYLAAWVDLGWLPVRGADGAPGPGEAGIEVGRLRDLVQRAPQLAQTRGTAAGLALFLRTATGSDIRVLDSGTAGGTVQRPFHLRVEVPRAAAAQRALIELIVRTEKPAHVTHQVVVQG